jgi:hypothetical protein
VEGGLWGKGKKSGVVAEQSIAKLCSKRYYRDLGLPAVGGVARTAESSGRVIGWGRGVTWVVGRIVNRQLSGQGQVTVRLWVEVKVGDGQVQDTYWV